MSEITEQCCTKSNLNNIDISILKENSDILKSVLNFDSNNDSNNDLKKDKKRKTTRRNNGEGSVYKRKDGRYVAQIMIGTSEEGKPIYKYFYDKKKSVVLDKLKNYIICINVNNDANKYYSDVTVDEYITKWVTTVKKNQVKASTYDRLVDTINNQIIPYIGNIKLTELTTQNIQENVINKLFNNGYSLSTIKKTYQGINACCKYATTTQPRALEFNPCTAVVLPNKNKFDKKEIRYFDKEEYTKFDIACKTLDNNNEDLYQTYEAFLFILQTGLRMGEVLALTWNDIVEETITTSDGNKSTIKEVRVNKNYVMAKNNENKRVMTLQNNPKTDSSNRIIPLNKKALEALESIKNKKYFGDNSLIFCNNKGKAILPRNFERTYNAICKRANIDNCCGVHTLRHTFATRLFYNGVDIKFISELLGHNSIQITYDTYIHIIENQKNDILRKLALDF